jgi:hypothetical protein
VEATADEVPGGDGHHEDDHHPAGTNLRVPTSQSIKARGRGFLW